MTFFHDLVKQHKPTPNWWVKAQLKMDQIHEQGIMSLWYELYDEILNHLMTMLSSLNVRHKAFYGFVNPIRWSDKS